jgi:beta-glucanase (GH16 family)
MPERDKMNQAQGEIVCMAELMKSAFRFALCVSVVLLAGCGGGGGGTTSGGGGTTQQAATPTISAATTTNTQNGAQMVTLTTTTSGATIYYTIDGTTPTSSSIVYEAPFLVASNLTINAIAAVSGDTNSSVATKTFAPNIASDTLVWSDEFANSTSANAQPNSLVWTYDTGNNSGWGNSELETYCAWGSTATPCSTTTPNAFVAPGGGLNIVAENPSSGVYTSARMKTEGLFSFQYGRIEASILLPESQGMWPAFWLLGNNIVTENWPACGEADVMEHIDGSDTPFGGPGTGSAPGYDWTQSSIHGTNLNGGVPYTVTGFSAATWHTYGMIWSKGKIEYYVDTPSNVYETFTPTTQTGTWPFDQGPQFMILNLAVGGSWPKSPDSSTPFPSTMKVDYVRVYTN